VIIQSSLWRFCIRHTGSLLHYDTVSEFCALRIAIKSGSLSNDAAAALKRSVVYQGRNEGYGLALHASAAAALIIQLGMIGG
jgi:hypothetical protein